MIAKRRGVMGYWRTRGLQTGTQMRGSCEVLEEWRTSEMQTGGMPSTGHAASDFLGAALKLNTWRSQSNILNIAFQTTTAHTTMLGNLPTLLLEKRQDQELPIKRANFSLCMGYKLCDWTTLIFAAEDRWIKPQDLFFSLTKRRTKNTGIRNVNCSIAVNISRA